jgi:NAD(P)-dependent dehydrogenase (short-subunit alcohol dehydrogenase family)
MILNRESWMQPWDKAAQLIAREGAKVVLTDIDEKEGAAAADEIASKGGEALFRHYDVSHETEWIDVIDRTVQR